MIYCSVLQKAVSANPMNHINKSSPIPDKVLQLLSTDQDGLEAAYLKGNERDACPHPNHLVAGLTDSCVC